jgi:pimeloyl-ACP methyl ester carboxylesterase
MPHLTLDQATINYSEVGPSDSAHPPVLFVHGALVDARLWSDVAKMLGSQGYRCILPNWPLGSHTIPVTDRAVLSPEGVAELIHQFIEAQGLRDVTLVGNDTGGGVCQFLIDKHPEGIGRLVLTNCDAFDTFPPFPFDAVFALMRSTISVRALSALMKVKALRHSAVGYGLLANQLNPELTRSWLNPVMTDPRIAGDFAELARGIGRTDLTETAPRLRRFTKPVTIVWGMRDRCFKPELGRRIAGLFPDCTFVEVPDSHTFVALDNPGAVVHAIERASAGG